MTAPEKSAETKTEMPPLLAPLCGNEDEDSSVESQLVSSIPFYDEESTLNITTEIADGFLIFLSGGSKNVTTVQKEVKKKKSKKSKKETLPSPASPSSLENNVQLAFATITDGNIIDAVFAVETCGGLKKRKETSQIAYNNAKTAKEAIRDAADSSESIKTLSINTYCRCFEIVITYNTQIEELGFITWCYKHQKIHDRARANLRKAFRPLTEAVNASI